MVPTIFLWSLLLWRSVWIWWSRVALRRCVFDVQVEHWWDLYECSQSIVYVTDRLMSIQHKTQRDWVHGIWLLSFTLLRNAWNLIHPGQMKTPKFVYLRKKCENVNFYIYQIYQMIINIMTPEITLRLPVTRKIICQKYYIKRTRPRFLYKVIRVSINGSLKYAKCGASQLIFLFIIYFLLFLLSYIFIYFF